MEIWLMENALYNTHVCVCICVDMSNVLDVWVFLALFCVENKSVPDNLHSGTLAKILAKPFLSMLYILYPNYADYLKDK